jgi:hypothetical protein
MKIFTKVLIAVMMFSAALAAQAGCNQAQLAGGWFSVGMGDYSTFMFCGLNVDKKGRITNGSYCGMIDLDGNEEDNNVKGTIKVDRSVKGFCTARMLLKYLGQDVEVIWGIDRQRTVAIGAGGLLNGSEPPISFTMVR